MGGYISTCYALRYPEDIEKLLLLSPVGVPELPEER
jgi:cardiolipin-specific phospholipase